MVYFGNFAIVHSRVGSSQFRIIDWNNFICEIIFNGAHVSWPYCIHRSVNKRTVKMPGSNTHKYEYCEQNSKMGLRLPYRSIRTFPCADIGPHTSQRVRPSDGIRCLEADFEIPSSMISSDTISWDSCRECLPLLDAQCIGLEWDSSWSSWVTELWKGGESAKLQLTWSFQSHFNCLFALFLLFGQFDVHVCTCMCMCVCVCVCWCVFAFTSTVWLVDLFSANCDWTNVQQTRFCQFHSEIPIMAMKRRIRERMFTKDARDFSE